MTELVVWGAVLLSVIGMMLIIAGTLAAGLFLPGIILLIAGMIAFVAAALLPLFRRARTD